MEILRDRNRSQPQSGILRDTGNNLDLVKDKNAYHYRKTHIRLLLRGTSAEHGDLSVKFHFEVGATKFVKVFFQTLFFQEWGECT